MLIKSSFEHLIHDANKQSYEDWIKMTPNEEPKVTKMEMLDNFDLPETPRETKYPWRELAEAGVDEKGKGKKTLVIRCENEEEAKSLKGNIASSGSSFYTRNELPFTPVARHFLYENGADSYWVVGVQIKTAE